MKNKQKFTIVFEEGSTFTTGNSLFDTIQEAIEFCNNNGISINQIKTIEISIEDDK